MRIKRACPAAARRPAPSGATPNGPAINQAQSEGSQQQPGTASKATEGSTSGSTQSGVPTGRGQPSGASQRPDTCGAPAETRPRPSLGTAQDGTPATDTPDASAQATIRDVVVTRNEAPRPRLHPKLPRPPSPTRKSPAGPSGAGHRRVRQSAGPGAKDHGSGLRPSRAVCGSNPTQRAQRRVFIRGIGKTSTVEALENSVGVNVDGVVLTNDAMTWATSRTSSASMSCAARKASRSARTARWAHWSSRHYRRALRRRRISLSPTVIVTSSL